jgi:hypothetical protein
MISRIALLCCWLLAMACNAQTPPPADSDPVATFKALAAKLPKTSDYSKGGAYSIQEPVVDVKKSDSLIHPLTGTIDCSVVTPNDTRLPMRFEFAWSGTAWTFTKLINRQNKREFTDLPGGRAILESEQVRAFLAPYHAK